MPLCLPALSVCLPPCLPVCLSVCLSVGLFVSLLPACLPASLPVGRSDYMPVRPSVRPSVSLFRCGPAFDSCDEYVVDRANEMVADRADVFPMVKTLSLQSFTFTEFFYRCTSEWPQVDWNTGLVWFFKFTQ